MTISKIKIIGKTFTVETVDQELLEDDGRCMMDKGRILILVWTVPGRQKRNRPP